MQHNFKNEMGDFEGDEYTEQTKADEQDLRDVAVDVHIVSAPRSLTMNWISLAKLFSESDA